jgi:tRNA-2-methylthio-N6-dimethylallyladenosine synthase
VQEQVCAELNRAQRGRALEVLVEGRDRDRWRGRTRANKLVFFSDPRPLLGSLVDVRIEWSGPWSMIGRAVDSAAENASDPLALTAR